MKEKSFGECPFYILSASFAAELRDDYNETQDVNKVAQMTGCSVEEIKEAIV